jgi:ATPase subunit of ABC transporter with duplicated ATPase domains
MPTDGEIICLSDWSTAYVPQLISDSGDLSGSQCLQKRLSLALAASPDLLLLDEPTNHLDSASRKSLLRMLSHYSGVLVIASHDVEVLRSKTDKIWHLDNQVIHEFYGSYTDYQREQEQLKAKLEQDMVLLKQENKALHAAQMQEQRRAASSRKKGEKSISQRKWPTVVSHAKMRRAEQTSGRKKAGIGKKKANIKEQLDSLFIPKTITPRFSLTTGAINKNCILSICRASIGYQNKDKPIFNNINLSLNGGERIAICGSNASGKSTLLKAMLSRPEVAKGGDWHLPHAQHIGYLDQRYAALQSQLTVIEHIRQARSTWNEAEVRRHLSDFLFCTNEEVNTVAVHLSGGEKARLCLSLIAAQTPRLLLLDEITNNLDLVTRQHVVQVLCSYPGAMVVVSHDPDFLQIINLDRIYQIEEVGVR